MKEKIRFKKIAKMTIFIEVGKKYCKLFFFRIATFFFTIKDAINLWGN